MRTILAILLLPAVLHAGTWDPYLWEHPQYTNISPDADELKAELQRLVAEVTSAGKLDPLRIHYGDVLNSGFFHYHEPGRILTTLAYAYPYLPAQQQSDVRTYVNTLLADANQTVWSTQPSIPNYTPNRRELYTPQQNYGWTFWWDRHGKFRPTVQTLYGLWLYCYRSGDWSAVNNATNWTNIKSFYTGKAAQANLYGTMGAHIAMARLAEGRNPKDTAARDTALANANTQLGAGTTFTTIDSRTATYYPEFFTGGYAARLSSRSYNGWVFLNLAPELGRYLNDTVKADVLTRHTSGTTKYPLWWMYQSPYFSAMAAPHDQEGIGLTPECHGMFFPIARWVAQDSAATLKSYLAAPVGKGDCHYMEALAQTIEAYGTLTWIDVRTQLPPPATLTVSSPNGGESYTAGQQITVTWNTTGTVGNVDIAISTNGGSTWTTLVTGTPNDGTQSITLPTTTGTQNRIRVQESDGTPTDASNANFNISAAPVAPTITTPPQNQTVYVSQNATFSVIATGTAPLSYQWQRNNTDIPNATTSSYTLANAALTDSGAQFRCRVSNSGGPTLSASATLTVNTAPAPTIASPLTFSPATVVVGQPVSFAITATDPLGGTLTYTWNFGDGGTSSDAAPIHTFSAPGVYTLSVTLLTPLGGAATQSAPVTVLAPDNGGGTGGGSGGGTGGGTGGGSGGGGTPGAPTIPMTVTQLAASMKFGVEAKDSVSLKGILPALPALFDPTDAVVALNIGGALNTFTLNAKGAAKNATGTFAIKFKTVRNKTTKKKDFLGGDVSFRAKLAKGTWSDDWSDEGATGTADAKNAPLTIAITLTFATNTYDATVPALYSAKTGKSGKFKK